MHFWFIPCVDQFLCDVVFGCRRILIFIFSFCFISCCFDWKNRDHQGWTAWRWACKKILSQIILKQRIRTQGAQGETGMKGERGDPGLPVSEIKTFIRNDRSNSLIWYRERMEYLDRKARGAKKVAKANPVELANEVEKAIGEKRVSKAFQAWTLPAPSVPMDCLCPAADGDHQK